MTLHDNTNILQLFLLTVHNHWNSVDPNNNDHWSIQWLLTSFCSTLHTE